jgi:Protein of unknown function (DUF3551)
MLRISFAVALLTASLAAPNAFAQGNPPNVAWCLRSSETGSMHCNYATLGQCQAARHGGADHCVRNQ